MERWKKFLDLKKYNRNSIEKLTAASKCVESYCKFRGDTLVIIACIMKLFRRKFLKSNAIIAMVLTGLPAIVSSCISPEDKRKFY